MGDGVPSKSTLVPPNKLSISPCTFNRAVTGAAGPMLVPKNVTINPGDTPETVPKLAALTMPGAVISGIFAASVTVDVLDRVGSTVLVAFTVTVSGASTTNGAMYNPVAEIVPKFGAMDHVTVLAALVTEAENCCV